MPVFTPAYVTYAGVYTSVTASVQNNIGACTGAMPHLPVNAPATTAPGHTPAGIFLNNTNNIKLTINLLYKAAMR